MDQSEDWAGLCEFCERSNYDLVQAHTGTAWGSAWTFVSNDVHAAEKAGRQMRRMGASHIRHAMRAELRLPDHEWRSVVIITELPGRTQIVLDLATAMPVQTALVMDTALRALESAAGLYLPAVAA
ncbi:MAG: hypothetical protein JWL77_2136 [Chthonomonadaceae bacterium]|nr:hypothetical protein [Chthonomonadaceae bacterium]